MSDDIFEPISQGSDRAQDEENSRIEAITNELRRRCKLYEAQFGNSQPHVSHAKHFTKHLLLFLSIVESHNLE